MANSLGYLISDLRLQKHFAAVHKSKYIGLIIKVNTFLLQCNILFPIAFSAAVTAQRKMPLWQLPATFR
jgi:hypothetical protein